MKIADERSSMVFENVDDGAAFEFNGRIYIKLDREIKDVDDGALYNAITLDGGNPAEFLDDCTVYLVNAEVIIK